MKNNKKVKRILLTGGGSGGPVTPLLAIVDALRHRGGGEEFLWIGTEKGPEKIMVGEEKIDFLSIASGKFRRYWSWQNFVDVFKIIYGFFQSLSILKKWRPDLVLSAGGYVSVQVIWASWLLRIPVMIHQQDIRPGLANKLMAPLARKITVTFEKSLSDYGAKAVWTGNPVRKRIVEEELGDSKQIKLKANLPVLLVVGGGTGASSINQLIKDDLKELIQFCQIIHIVGHNRHLGLDKVKESNYHFFEFLKVDEMAYALKKADLVVSRCGLGFLTELAYLGKPAILIPMPDGHQEDNADFFAQNGALVWEEKDISSAEFIAKIQELLQNQGIKKDLGAKMKKIMRRDANEKILTEIDKI